MKVLVTGSSGYIGQHLCAFLKSKQHEVWGLDNTFGDETYIDEFRCIDITNQNDLIAGCWNDITFDAVIHLAALVQVGESVKDPLHYYQTNIQGTINCMKYISYDNFVFASTGAAAAPTSPYAISKFAAEQCVRQYLNDVPYTIFRFYNVIGSAGYEPTNPDGLFYNLMKAERTGQFNLYGDDYSTPDGTAIRDYVHVTDICRAHIHAYRYLENKGAQRIVSAVLVDKDLGREKPYRADHIGLVTENRYLFGFGLDYKGYLRNWPGIYACRTVY